LSVTNKDVRVEKAAEQCLAANEVVSIVRDKWTILVLGALRRNDSLRYTELQRAVDGISQRMLTLTLKSLERNGLVKRTLFATVPPRVDYELTPVGRTLIKPLRGLLDWSLEHRDAMLAARRAYASRDH
jgi:DNA-binding HxlR family transcriptional regulator